MARRSTIAALMAGTLVVILSGCGAAATPIPSTGGVAAASQPAESAAGSVAEASTGAASPESSTGSSAGGILPSFAIPSLPSQAKDLEALLPSTMCGAAATKTSLTGAALTTAADPTFIATLQALGKTVNDVSFALAFSTDQKCGAGIFRIAGADPGTLQSTMVAQQQKSGETFTQGNVGGKSVFISNSSSGAGKQYVYFHGDAVVFAQAPDDTAAATILQALP